MGYFKETGSKLTYKNIPKTQILCARQKYF
jgi:hypothetical protein